MKYMCVNKLIITHKENKTTKRNERINEMNEWVK